MTNREKDLLVSILNHIAEQIGWVIDNEGFGYSDNNSDIDCMECSLEEGLADLWEDVRQYKLVKK